MQIPEHKVLFIPNPAAMEQLGRELSACCPGGTRIFLQGELGAGKTTLVRGFMRGLGFHGRVKSPTYTLVEPYEIGEQIIHHIDLYRIREARELETLGWRDYLDSNGICLLEWPERGQNYLGRPDVLIEFQIDGTGRSLTLTALTVTGQDILIRLNTTSIPGHEDA